MHAIKEAYAARNFPTTADINLLNDSQVSTRRDTRRCFSNDGDGHRRHCTGEIGHHERRRECLTFTQYARKHNIPADKRARIRDGTLSLAFSRVSFGNTRAADHEMEGITEDGSTKRRRKEGSRKVVTNSKNVRCTLKGVSDFGAYEIPFLFSNKHSNVKW